MLASSGVRSVIDCYLKRELPADSAAYIEIVANEVVVSKDGWEFLFHDDR